MSEQKERAFCEMRSWPYIHTHRYTDRTELNETEGGASDKGCKKCAHFWKCLIIFSLEDEEEKEYNERARVCSVSSTVLPLLFRCGEKRRPQQISGVKGEMEWTRTSEREGRIYFWASRVTPEDKNRNWMDVGIKRPKERAWTRARPPQVTFSFFT